MATAKKAASAAKKSAPVETKEEPSKRRANSTASKETAQPIAVKKQSAKKISPSKTVVPDETLQAKSVSRSRKPIAKLAQKKAAKDTSATTPPAKTALSPSAAWPFPTGNKP